MSCVELQENLHQLSFKTVSSEQIMNDEDYERIKSLFVETALKYLLIRDYSRFDATREAMEELFKLGIDVNVIVTFLVHAHLVDVIEGVKKAMDQFFSGSEREIPPSSEVEESASSYLI